MMFVSGMKFKAFTDAGALAVGYKVYTYEAGTSTLKDTYTDSTLLSANTNPVILDGRGEASIWLGSGSYKFVLKDANDVTIQTVDQISAKANGLTTALAIASGGTGATSKTAAFDALSPLTTAGDIIYGGASGTGTRLGAGTATQVLKGGTTPSWAAVVLTTDVSGVLPFANGGAGPDSTTEALFHAIAQRKERATYSSDTAITQKDGFVLITKGSAAALTLAAPTAGTDDGKEMLILSTTAFAHTVTQTTPGFNNGGAASDVATFGAAVGNWFRVIAYNGVWYIVGALNVTAA